MANPIILPAGSNQVSFYKIEFREPPVPGTDKTVFYFGSLAAIFDVFTPDQVGCKIENLWNKKLSDSGSWSGSKSEISHCILIRKITKRGGRKS